MPDGRLRLFYFGPPEKGLQPGHESTIYSAISTDGVIFESEGGERITVLNVTDPSVVILPDESWLMALSRGPETLLAASPDGNTFELTGVTTSVGGVPELTVLPDGSLRLYVTGEGGIRSLYSTDNGLNWKEEDGIRIPGRGNIAADPSVIQLGDGSWLMAWKRFNPDDAPKPGNPEVNPPP